MARMAVVSSTPVVRGVSVATVIRIWLGIRVVRSPVVPVGIIIVACRISVIASRKSKTESHPGNPDSPLSVSTLPGNQSQSAYRQSNQEVAIVGMPDERWGEAPHAFVVLKAGATTTETELRNYARPSTKAASHF